MCETPSFRELPKGDDIDAELDTSSEESFDHTEHFYQLALNQVGVWNPSLKCSTKKHSKENPTTYGFKRCILSS